MELENTTTTETTREMVSFTHYDTKEVRQVAMPDKLQQFSREFITAFMTSEEHYEDLPWYREVRQEAFDKVKAEKPTLNDADLKMKSFPKVRIEFVKKYFPQFAPKVKAPREKKPAKLDMWDI